MVAFFAGFRPEEGDAREGNTMDRSRIPLIAGALVIAGVIGYLRSAPADALDYSSSWGSALEEARTTGKPLLIVFGGSW